MFKDQAFVITGGTSGIGLAICRRIVAGGGRVLLMGRDSGKLDNACHVLGANFASCEVVDFLDKVDFQQVVGHIFEKLGKVHGFVHAAGIERTKPFRNITERDIEEVMRVNFFSGANLLRALLANRAFNKEGGSIVFIGSVMSILGQASKTAYCAAKGAMVPFTKSLALELARRSIRVNMVLPGLVETEMSNKLFKELSTEAKLSIERMHPLGFGKPDDVASAVAFLLSSDAKWITGSELIVDGGYSCH